MLDMQEVLMDPSFVMGYCRAGGTSAIADEVQLSCLEDMRNLGLQFAGQVFRNKVRPAVSPSYSECDPQMRARFA